MASPKLNADEKRDLDKFTKFLALKAAQIIVQSRRGNKLFTHCVANTSGSDWFNLAVQDLPDVLTEAKKALCCEGDSTRLALCVDISLRTFEGDTMMLETWNLGIVPDECDSNVRVTYTIYNRMGLLLKSLITVTRVIPGYRLSRRQSPDSYVICHRIYMGDPQLHQLGEGYQQVNIGQLCTPIGTIHLTVSYRTKMTISPQATDQDAPILITSHNFPRKSSIDINDDYTTSMSDTLKVGAFADELNKTELDERLIIPDTPFSSLLKPKHSPPPPATPPQILLAEANFVNENDSGSETESLTDGNGNLTPKPRSRADSRASSISFTSTNDEFFMVDSKTPFANNSTSADLGTFYKECQQAPPLQEFEEQPATGETVSELAKQLENFELSVPKFDQLLTTLCSGDVLN